MTDNDIIIRALEQMAEDVYSPELRAKVLRIKGELEDERLRERGDRLL